MTDSVSPGDAPTDNRTLAWIIIVISGLVASFGVYENRFFSHDDAFITFRYATHLAHGFGLRWNQTGVPVEGFSSPLHLLLLAGLSKSGFSLLSASRFVGFTAHLFLAILVFSYLQKQVSRNVAALACGIVISSWPLLVWDLGGLEVSLFALFLCAGVVVSCLCLETHSLYLAFFGGLAFGLALLARAEGLSILLTASGSMIVLKRGPLASRLKASLCTLCSATLVYIPWEVFRCVYFNDYLPNTYWAKVAGVPLLWRLASGTTYLKLFLTLPPFLLLLTLLASIGALKHRRFLRQLALLWLSFSAYTASVTIVGGDHMTAFRFFAPVIPVLALIVGLSVGSFRNSKGSLLVNMWCGVFLITSSAQAGAWHLNPRFREVTCAGGEAVAERIRKAWPAGSSVALSVAGSIPYYADAFVYIDMLGLNDRIIAKRKVIPLEILTNGIIGHLKGDGAYLLSQKPDYIIFETAFGGQLRPNETGVSLTPFELARSPLFFELYQQCTLHLDVPQHIRRESILPEKMALFYFQKRELGPKCSK